jgi:hypothetical protein
VKDILKINVLFSIVGADVELAKSAALIACNGDLGKISQDVYFKKARRLLSLADRDDIVDQANLQYP